MKRTRQGDPHGQERKHCAVRHRSFIWRSQCKRGFHTAPPPSADSGMRRHFRIFIKQRKDKVMNDMEKCFYEPAELSVVDEERMLAGKGER